ncbi:hypothetical protein [Streptomyces erythrochromogenes]|uniref:hypothetical protein n=1 Tax=Streptomyces erythrochromogenes TaxID=285574 RepID=UPI0036F96332
MEENLGVGDVDQGGQKDPETNVIAMVHSPHNGLDGGGRLSGKAWWAGRGPHVSGRIIRAGPLCRSVLLRVTAFIHRHPWEPPDEMVSSTVISVAISLARLDQAAPESRCAAFFETWIRGPVCEACPAERRGTLVASAVGGEGGVGDG